MKTGVVNIGDLDRGIRMVPNHRTSHGDMTRIDRKTGWGNPPVIGRDGNRNTVIKRYRKWMKREIAEGGFADMDLSRLHDKTLVCRCGPLPCHGDVPAKLAGRAWKRIGASEDRTLEGVGEKTILDQIQTEG